MRGESYPTETNVDSGDDGDKAIYNALTWAEVNAKMEDIQANNAVPECRGPDTPTPTGEPSKSPTTLQPTPAPTRIPTTHTPAPTFSENYEFKTLVNTANDAFDDAADAATDIQAACEAAGYDRQYDATQYVVRLTMGPFNDYYTIAPTEDTDGGQYVSICEMLGDPATNKPLWAANPEGPFREVDLTANNGKTPDGRRYPGWLDRGDDTGKGYGTDDAGDLTAVGNVDYTLAVTTARVHNACVEREDPNDAFEVCTNNGADGQLWDDTAEECGTDPDNRNLHYALSNAMHATCDDLCVWHPDFTDGAAQGEQTGQFWYWTGSCWKPRSGYAGGEFQHCDTLHDSFQYDTQWAFVQLRQARLCAERCDYVTGWKHLGNSCYRLIDQTEYSGGAGANNVEKANDSCGTLHAGATLASIGNEGENDDAVDRCNGICYIGNDPAGKGTEAGGFRDGTPIMYANWNGGYEGATGTGEGEDYLALQTDGTWAYDVATKTLNALCEYPADLDEDDNGKATAMYCMENGADTEHMQTNLYPTLEIADSGFTDAANPGNLHIVVTVPKYMYNPYITFENATNDAAEHNWRYTDDAWTVTEGNDPVETDDAADCDTANNYEGVFAWTVFNLGGAGGIQRLATWEGHDGTDRTETDPDTDLDGDGYENHQYLFGATVMIQATQPIFTKVDLDDATFAAREATFHREVVARIPFILQFQKTVTVTTDVDIISTKFNYKTVAAIIQSIQFDTQFFAPPYASIKLQIRTKSQYPYLFNKDPTTIKLHPIVADTDNDNVDMSIVWLQDDKNCTFTNPDHMREGDICTQEWMLTLVPNANVCYATGEYSIEYEADCFYNKDVCYLPMDANGDEITTVTFTFKVQTSKFCPTVADEVDLAGTLTVTGRESFKPDSESVEDATDGQYYLQGETIHVFAETVSQKAVITSTKVVMVEIEQDLSELVMTGYNRVPFDATSEDLTVWTEDGTGRIATGTVKINDGTGTKTVALMNDDDVFGSGSSFEDAQGNEVYTFSETEAGFRILLHAKAFPVNVDSFGTKTLVATLEVTYEAIAGFTRRRLLAQDRNADLRRRTEFKMQPWKPVLGVAHNGVASMSMGLSIPGSPISRGNVRAFVQSFEGAIFEGLNEERGKKAGTKVYHQQIAVESVFSNGKQIWARPTVGGLNVNKRKLLAVNKPTQTLKVEFTFIRAPYHDAMTVQDMLTIFEKQLRSPSSPLMFQPVFYGAVIHNCVAIEPTDYRWQETWDNPTETGAGLDDPLREIESEGDLRDIEESSASRSLPVLAALVGGLLVALW